MPEKSAWVWYAFIFFSLVGIWVIFSKTRTYRLSGFRFYLFAGLMAGIPFLILGLVFFYSPNVGILSTFFFYLLSRLGLEWGVDQEEKAERADPARWKEWHSKMSKHSLISRFFL